MIDNNSQLYSGKPPHAEVCIVGGGVAGLILAHELAEQGRQVTVLESGNQATDAIAQSLNHGDNTGYPYYPLDLVRERRLGGTSVRWGIDLGDGREGVRLRPLDPIDFEKRPEVPHSGWPFGYEVLAPYYERAHPYFGLGPCDYRAKTWQRTGSHEALDLDEEQVETTLFQFGDPAKIHTSLRQKLENHERVNIFLNTTVLELVLNEAGNRVESLRLGGPNQKETKLTATEIVLAMGGLEIPRLLLLSDRQEAGGVGNRHDLVGRFFMEHPHYLSGMLIPEDRSLFRKTALYTHHHRDGSDLLGYLKLSETAVRDNGLLNYCVSLWPRSTTEAADRESFLSTKAYAALRKIRSAIHIGERPSSLAKQLYHIARQSDELLLHLFSKANPGRSETTKAPFVAYQLHNMSEQAPNPDSRVTLSKEKDYFGQRRIQLNWRLSELDYRTIERSQELIDQTLRKSGIGHLQREPIDSATRRSGITGGLHHMGTTRMHADPRKGVVDPDCKVHGLDNLFVASSSVFPTSGCANPTLTIAALALRLADHLRKSPT